MGGVFEDQEPPKYIPWSFTSIISMCFWQKPTRWQSAASGRAWKRGISASFKHSPMALLGG